VEEIMQTAPITVANLKRAIEGRDAGTLSDWYADDAVVRIIDCNNPPSRPRELRGKASIAAYYDDVCSRAMSHEVEFGLAQGDRLAFTQVCAYPDGIRVFCAATLDLADGEISRQTVVQAWDG
jgi:ketosteroid isomerase-like protein